MEKYRDKSGNSGVTAYEPGSDFIKVQFQSKEEYLYNSVSPGIEHVKNMKKLALEGKGLASYINVYVKDDYYKKLK